MILSNNWATRSAKISAIAWQTNNRGFRLKSLRKEGGGEVKNIQTPMVYGWPLCRTDFSLFRWLEFLFLNKCEKNSKTRNLFKCYAQLSFENSNNIIIVCSGSNLQLLLHRWVSIFKVMLHQERNVEKFSIQFFFLNFGTFPTVKTVKLWEC